MQSANRVIVIGGGLAGCEAARAAMRLGADVTLITDNLSSRTRLDQTAIRFLASEAERVEQAWEPEGPAPGSDYAAAMRETLVGAIEISARDFDNRMAELQDIGIQIIEGRGSVSAPDAVSVTRPGGQPAYMRCRSTILAPGADSFLGAESPCVITPSSIHSLDEVPESLIVLGSSAAALELARFFSAYGVFVTVVGARVPALGFLDEELRLIAVDRTADNQIRIVTGVTAIAGTTDGRADILLSDDTHIDADYALPCGEGSIRTDGLGLEGPGVVLGTDGEILTDKQMRTNIPEIFAAGSVTGCLSPNIAVAQAKIAAENAMGGEAVINYDVIPFAAWFDPQMGSVGLTQEQAEREGIMVLASAAYFPSEPGPERCVKFVADESTERILGVHAIGDGAVEAAHLGALAMHAGITLSDIAEISCIEGTMAESMAAAALRGRQPLSELVRPLVTGPG